MHYIQYLSGIISEERFYEIEEKFNEGLARNLMGEVPEDIFSPGSKLYPFTAQVEITGK